MTEPVELSPTDDDLESTALLALADGPLSAGALATRMRRRFRSRTMDARLVEMLVERSLLLVGRPDGSVIRLIDLLEDSTFTVRVAHADGTRRDLWVSLALAPLITWMDREGLCLSPRNLNTLISSVERGSAPSLVRCASHSMTAVRSSASACGPHVLAIESACHGRHRCAAARCPRDGSGGTVTPMDDLSAPRSLGDEGALRNLADEPGVHVVFDERGRALYVGMSRRTRSRIRMHLSGDREASILHEKIGRRLDAELGRTAHRDEIRSWLEHCSFSVLYTDDLSATKAALMDELQPPLNDIRPTADS